MKKLINLLTVSILFCFGTGFLYSQSKTTEIGSIQDENKIAYLFFKINKNSSGSEKISLYETKIVKGKIKLMPAFNREEIKNGDFVITLIDDKGTEVVKQHLGDPLNPELESFGDEISRHKLVLQESEFSFRFPYSNKIKTITIEKIKNSAVQLIFTQNL